MTRLHRWLQVRLSGLPLEKPCVSGLCPPFTVWQENEHIVPITVITRGVVFINVVSLKQQDFGSLAGCSSAILLLTESTVVKENKFLDSVSVHFLLPYLFFCALVFLNGSLWHHKGCITSAFHYCCTNLSCLLNVLSGLKWYYVSFSSKALKLHLLST